MAQLLKLPDGGWIKAEKVLLIYNSGSRAAIDIDTGSEEIQTYDVYPEECKQRESDKLMTVPQLIDYLAQMINDHLRAEGGDK